MAESISAPRSPPHDIQAEMGVLGSMLLSGDIIFMARERLAGESFYKLAHQEIFDAILSLSDKHNTVDLILLRNELKKRERLEAAGGVAYLAELMEAVPTSANAEHYMAIVREHAMRRHLIKAAAAIQKSSYEDAQDVDGLLDRAEAGILAVRHQKDSERTTTMDGVLQYIVERLEEAHQHPGQLTGLATGFYDLDRITNGMQKGEFIVVAARPSVGKTSLALNIMHHVCVQERRPAALYTLEMSAEQIGSNLLCIHNRLDTLDFRRGTLTEEQWGRVDTSMDDLVALPLYITDAPSMTVMDLRARARRLHHQHQVELIVVDYLQLLRSDRRTENRAVEVAEISQGLKALARELGVPLIAVAQLNRSVDTEQRRPRMSDLRESGAIEQDADVVILLHRQDRFKEEEDESPWEESGERDQLESVAEVIVAKQRNGPTGACKLLFKRRCLRFDSPSSTETR